MSNYEYEIKSNLNYEIIIIITVWGNKKINYDIYIMTTLYSKALSMVMDMTMLMYLVLAE